jgi:hypothetical protein
MSPFYRRTEVSSHDEVWTASPDEIEDADAEDINSDNDEQSGAYERGFEAGECDARDGSKTDNPYILDTFLTSHELWQDGYEAANGAGGSHDQN